MAATYFSAVYGVRLSRPPPCLLKSCSIPLDDRGKFHLDASGSSRIPPRRTKAQVEFLTQMKLHSPVTASMIPNKATGWFLIRLIICGTLPPRVSAFNKFLKCYMNNELKPRIGKPFLAQFLVSGVIPDLATFSVLLRFYCKQLAYRDVLDLVFTQMKAMEVVPDDSFYKTLIDGVCARFGPYLAFLLLRKLSHRIQVPLHCYDALVGHLSKREMADQTSLKLVLNHVMTHMQQQRVFPDEIIYNFLLQGRDYGDYYPVNNIKPMAIGSQMLAQGIRNGTVSPTTAL